MRKLSIAALFALVFAVLGLSACGDIEQQDGGQPPMQDDAGF